MGLAVKTLPVQQARCSQCAIWDLTQDIRGSAVWTKSSEQTRAPSKAHRSRSGLNGNAWLRLGPSHLQIRRWRIPRYHTGRDIISLRLISIKGNNFAYTINFHIVDKTQQWTSPEISHRLLLRVLALFLSVQKWAGRAQRGMVEVRPVRHSAP